MWCNVCQCDVVTELTADHSRAVCSTCGQVLSAVAGEQPTPPPQPETGNPRAQARDLLDRWASSHLFDPYAPPPQGVGSPPATAAPATVEAAAAVGPVPSEPAVGHQPGIVPHPHLPAAQLASAQQIAAPPNQPSPGTPIYQTSPQTAATASPLTPVVAPHSPGQPPTAFQEVVPQPPAPTPATQPAVTGETGFTTSPQVEQPTAPALQTSAEELDKLTNEILSRVSQISEDRQQRIERAAAELAEAENREPETHGATNDDDHFAGIDLTRRVDSGHDRETESEPAEPKTSRSDEITDHDSVAADEIETMTEVTTLHSSVHASDADASTDDTRAGSNAESEPEESGLPGIGHILAYVGILGLTAGTSLVIVGYFGGPTTYAPTGWLVSTIGQMLLFLGIVTLVSNGMEQTSEELQKTVNNRMDELSGRMESLGDRLIRIESAESGRPGRPHMLDRSGSRRRQDASVTRD